MATHDVPGANPANRDKLGVGNWAEDNAGTSLIFVAGLEGTQVIFQMYDLGTRMFYQDAMLKTEFESMFSQTDWTWHDKTSFPWDKVISRVQRPIPQHADVLEGLSAAAKVAEALKLRGRSIRDDDVQPAGADDPRTRGYAVMDRIAEALGRFVGPDR